MIQKNYDMNTSIEIDRFCVPTENEVPHSASKIVRFLETRRCERIDSSIWDLKCQEGQQLPSPCRIRVEKG